MKKLSRNHIYSFFLVILFTLALSNLGQSELFAEEVTTSEITSIVPEESTTPSEMMTTFPEESVTTEINKASLSLAKKSYKLYPGQSIEPEIYCSEENIGEITYSSLDTSVATFKNGVITAKSKGKTKVYVKTTDYQLEIKVTVKKAIKKIIITQDQISLNKNDKRFIHTNIVRNHSNEPVVWKSSNEKVVTVNKKGRITGKKNGTAYISCTSKYSKKTDKIKVNVKDTKYIAFTFDDGPGPYTDALLRSLKKYDSKATFFVVGNRLDNYASILQKEYFMGHEIGNHSYSHPNLAKLTYKEVKQELRKTNGLTKKYTDENATLIRPPYGSYDKTVTSVAKVPLILWSVDTLDWKYRDSDYVKDTILSHAADGEIVLLHDIHETSVVGFQKAIKELKEQGYELVTVSELYQIKGIKMQPKQTYFGL